MLQDKEAPELPLEPKFCMISWKLIAQWDYKILRISLFTASYRKKLWP